MAWHLSGGGEEPLSPAGSSAGMIEVELLESRGFFTEEAGDVWIAMSVAGKKVQWTKLEARATFTTWSYGRDRYFFDAKAQVRFEAYFQKERAPSKFFGSEKKVLLGRCDVAPWLERGEETANFRWIRLELASSTKKTTTKKKKTKTSARRRLELRVAVVAHLGAVDRASAADATRRWFYRPFPLDGLARRGAYQRANVLRLAVVRCEVFSQQPQGGGVFSPAPPPKKNNKSKFFLAARVRDSSVVSDLDWTSVAASSRPDEPRGRPVASTKVSADGVFAQMLCVGVTGGFLADDASLDLAVVDATKQNKLVVVGAATVSLGKTEPLDDSFDHDRQGWIQLGADSRAKVAWRLDYDESRDDREVRPFFDDELYGVDVEAELAASSSSGGGQRNKSFTTTDSFCGGGGGGGGETKEQYHAQAVVVRPVNALRVVVARARRLASTPTNSERGRMLPQTTTTTTTTTTIPGGAGGLGTPAALISSSSSSRRRTYSLSSSSSGGGQHRDERLCGATVYHYGLTTTEARSTKALPAARDGAVVWNECFEFAFEKERVSCSREEMVRVVVGGDDFPPREVWADAPRHRVSRSWYELGDGAQVLVVAQRYFDDSLVAQDVRDVALEHLALAFPDVAYATVESVFDSTADLADACVALGALAAVHGDDTCDLGHVAASNATDLSWVLSPLVDDDVGDRGGDGAKLGFFDDDNPVDDDDDDEENDVPRPLPPPRPRPPNEEEEEEEEEGHQERRALVKKHKAGQLVRCSTQTSLLGPKEAPELIEAADIAALSVDYVFKTAAAAARKKRRPFGRQGSMDSQDSQDDFFDPSATTRSAGPGTSCLEYADGVRSFSPPSVSESSSQQSWKKKMPLAEESDAFLACAAVARTTRLLEKTRRVRRRLVVRVRTECVDFKPPLPKRRLSRGSSSSFAEEDDDEGSFCSTEEDDDEDEDSPDDDDDFDDDDFARAPDGFDDDDDDRKKAPPPRRSSSTLLKPAHFVKKWRARSFVRKVAARWEKTPFELAKVQVEVLRTPRDFATLRAGLVAKLKEDSVPPLPGWVEKALNLKAKTTTVSVAAGLSLGSVAAAVAVATGGVAPLVAVAGGVALGAVALAGARKTTKSTIKSKLDAELATCTWLRDVHANLRDRPKTRDVDEARTFLKHFLARGGRGKVFQRPKHRDTGNLDRNFLCESISTAPPRSDDGRGGREENASRGQDYDDGLPPPPPPPEADYLISTTTREESLHCRPSEDNAGAPPPPPPPIDYSTSPMISVDYMGSVVDYLGSVDDPPRRPAPPPPDAALERPGRPAPPPPRHHAAPPPFPTTSSSSSSRKAMLRLSK